MTHAAYYSLLALEVVTLAVLGIELFVMASRENAEKDRETKEFEKRIAARLAANTNAPAVSGNNTKAAS